MTRSTYKPVDIREFGSNLLKTNDLDPVYVALYRAQLPDAQMFRWLLAYWCFYSVGQASWLSEQQAADFWHFMYAAAANEVPSPLRKRWERGRERRHFRGEFATRAVRALDARHHSPERFASTLLSRVGAGGAELRNFLSVSGWVQDHLGFGPWIAFKIADMLERILAAPIAFSNAEVFMYSEPRAGAVRVYRALRNEEPPSEDEAIHVAMGFLQEEFGTWPAPPRYERSLNLQEYETILCKWKSHLNGHYPLGNDLREVAESFHHWAEVSVTAERLLRSMPNGDAIHLP